MIIKYNLTKIQERLVCSLLSGVVPALEVGNRFMLGMVMFATGAVTRVSKRYYTVKSSNKTYNVHQKKKRGCGNGWEWSCDCKDYKHRRLPCKHMYAAHVVSPLQEFVQRQVRVVRKITLKDIKCPKCKSGSCIRKGSRKNKGMGKPVIVQQYGCKACGHRFVFRPGFKRMRYPARVITHAILFYISNGSYKKVAEQLKETCGVSPNISTIYRWHTKYVPNIWSFLQKITPNTGGKWHADEISLRIRGVEWFLMSVMDSATRFMISFDMASSKNNADATHIFERARALACKTPDMLVTDSLAAYAHAFARVFAPKNPKHKHSIHIHDTHIQNEWANNNKMERANETIRERFYTNRSLMKHDSVSIAGFFIWYNFLRLHGGIGNKTPAEMAGIIIQGHNKLYTLIQHSALAAS